MNERDRNDLKTKPVGFISGRKVFRGFHPHEMGLTFAPLFEANGWTYHNNGIPNENTLAASAVYLEQELIDWLNRHPFPMGGYSGESIESGRLRVFLEESEEEDRPGYISIATLVFRSDLG